tara:strand:- start:542 stop:661 length:120 start_codon:yes stop_codon:yes gene_type:complete
MQNSALHSGFISTHSLVRMAENKKPSEMLGFLQGDIKDD